MFRYSPEGLLRGIYVRADGLSPTVLDHARLFDGREWQTDVRVVVEGGVITQLGKSASIDSPRDARTLDVSGHWLLPGLVDCRAYVVGQPPDEIARPQATRFKTSGPILAHRAAADANTMLSGGITGVTQLDGGDVEYVSGLREAVRTGLIAGPTIITAGKPLSSIAGGVEAWQEPGMDPDARLPGTGILRRPSRQTAVVAATPDGVRKAIRRNFVDGADMVMLLLTSESASEQLGLTDAELASATDEAQRVGARIAVQATGNRPARAAVRAGVDLLVLGPAEPHPELVDLLSKGRTAWAPGLAGRQGGVNGRLCDAVGEVHARGGRIVVGTGWRRNHPVSFGSEVAAIVAAGVPPADALSAATTVGGMTLGLAAGPPARGERANLVAFRSDPLANLSALGQPGTATLIIHSVPGRRLTPLQSLLGVRTTS